VAQPAGIVTTASPHDVSTTVDRLVAAIAQRGLTLFVVIDHSAGARSVGLELPDTTVVVFGSPKAGTPVMLAQPLSALDLPLKVLVRASDGDGSLVSYPDPSLLADRYGVPPDLLAPLEGVRALVEAATAST
jgi:uncharacterized protein (DUF302 family)